jgi:DNA-binding NarL/FixJ family response regulator
MKTHAAATPIRLIVADTHSLFRSALVELVRLLDTATVVGQAGDAGEALHVACHVDADLIVLDLDMPGAKELSLIKALKDRLSELPILILSAHDDARSLSATLAAGVSGYITKHIGIVEFETAIRTAATGGRYVSPKRRGNCGATMRPGNGIVAPRATDSPVDRG